EGDGVVDDLARSVGRHLVPDVPGRPDRRGRGGHGHVRPRAPGDGPAHHRGHQHYEQGDHREDDLGEDLHVVDVRRDEAGSGQERRHGPATAGGVVWAWVATVVTTRLADGLIRSRNGVGYTPRPTISATSGTTAASSRHPRSAMVRPERGWPWKAC